ncbi:GNAT family N-acetyltransferase [Nocardioides ferulae]|uniref:bifunctional acetate--CoA ligase family protein/GNAT family N-acetyltransferase n=1 Tax=Nocardioides ferulae TaxID=2340821 RepID=UPI000EB4619E|nr:GNAT family N-acetyltransferase [Nocardioides ferulae]
MTPPEAPRRKATAKRSRTGQRKAAGRQVDATAPAEEPTEQAVDQATDQPTEQPDHPAGTAPGSAADIAADISAEQARTQDAPHDAEGLGDPSTTADVLLSDGSVGRIRALRPDDEEALDRLHDRVSDENLRLRFFSASRKASRDYVDHLLRDEGPLVLVAEARAAGDSGREIVALGTAEPIGPEVAEIAFLVDDSNHGRGLGSLLLEHLAALGRAHGIRRFEAEVLAENHAMLGVFLAAGFTTTRHPEAGEVHVEMDTVASARAVAAADEREARAETRSLRPLLYPRSVAVAGVRADGSGVGAAALRTIAGSGFGGPVYVVHPRAARGRRIAGVPAYRSVTKIPEHVDLVVVAVPAANVIAALEDAAAAGVGAAVVVTSGFAEMGEEGARLQARMLDLARASSMRIVGPNSLGVIANHVDLRLNATFSGEEPPVGGLAVATQSGGVGIVIDDLARELGLGVGALVSLGDKVDVSSNDLLAAWRDDEHVAAAALYLESFGNAPKFVRFARRFSERKPLLAVLGSRSVRRGGVEAKQHVGVDALFAQSGVISCQSAEEMVEAALLLTQQPLPRGPRVGILSNAQGLGNLAADAAEEWGLVVPELSEELWQRITRDAVGFGTSRNPVDAGISAGAGQIAAIAEELVASGEIDAMIVVLVSTQVIDVAAAVEEAPRIRRRHPELPVLIVPIGGLQAVPTPLDGVTRFGSARAAARALGRAWRYAEWLSVAREPLAGVDAERGSRARALADDLLGFPDSGSWLGPEATERLLGDYGLAPIGPVVQDPVTAAQSSTEIGFPVAVKVAGRDIVHKTERGLVRVGLRSAAEVVTAVRAFERELGHEDIAVRVQPVVAGTEVALSVRRDPVFGPLVTVSGGGLSSELWDDRVRLVPPVTRGDASRALRALRAWPALDASPQRDLELEALERLVVQVGQLAEEVPQIAELDVNPVIVGDGCACLVDVNVRLGPLDQLDLGVPRQLRRSLPVR